MTDPRSTSQPLGVRAVQRVARVCPHEPTVPSTLEQSLALLDWPLDGQTLLEAGDALAVLVGLAVLAVIPFAPTLAPVFVMAGALVAAAVSTGVRRLPVLLATARRTRALGAAPDLVSRAVLRLRLSPSPERAAAFAAETNDGLLAASLATHVRGAQRSSGSALAAFGDEWAAWFPALRRACVLVESAASAPPGERERTLDRALEATLEGTRETMTEFAGRIRGPTTALYAFGVLVPMALVALLPAAGAAGLRIGLPTVVVVYDLVLPAGLAAASCWILAHRPVAFPPPSVDADHPSIPDRQWPRTLSGVAVGALAWPAATAFCPGWTGPIAGIGVGVGVTLVARYRPVRAVHEQVRAVERGLADALYLVGRDVERGRSVERALADTAEEVDGATGDVLADAARQQRQLNVGVRAALLGGRGALATVPSQRAHSVAELLAVAASEGKPAGRAVVAMAEHVEDLQSVERTARRELERVTATLGHTAAFFGPLVGGATVALSRQLAGDGPLADSAVPPSDLGVAVAGYVLVLAAVLTALVVGLEYGFDRALVGYRVGLAVLTATASFLFALTVTATLL